MKNLPQKTIGEVASIERNVVDAQKITPDSPYVGLEDIEPLTGNVNYKTAQEANVKSAKNKFNNKHVLFGRLRPYLAKVARPDREGICSTDILTLKSGKYLNRDYLFYFLLHPNTISTASSRTSGANLPRLSPKELAKITIPLPSLNTQEKIGDLLNIIDTQRKNRRTSLELLDELMQSLFIDMFGDPVSNTKNWETEKLGNLSRIIRGASPRPKGDPRYFGGPIPWLMISDVTRTQGNTVTKIREGVTEAGRDKSVYLPKGSLILTNSATVGVPKFLGVDTCIHDGFLGILDISHKINKEYLYNLFLLNRERISQMAPEGTQKNLNTGIAKSLEIPIPPLEIQESFVERSLQISLLRESHQTHLSHLDELFSSVQQRAFDGTLWDDPVMTS